MKPTTRKLLLAGLAGVSILSAAAVIAGGPGSGCPGGHVPGMTHGMSGHGPGMMGHGPGWGGSRHALHAPEDRADSHLEVLKSELKLQPGQESAWNAFATAARAQAKTMGQARAEMSDKARTMPERMELANKLAKEREQGMDKVSQAMKALYETLTPEQRKALDQRGPWNHG
ncbi:MAG: Spy/CpxP family protein refolding chaperone [Pseudomonadota bacterium]